MRRDYVDIMKTNGLGEFVSACNTIKNCKFVVAETKIAGLLKAIADNKQLYSMFSAALYGFDYKQEFSACIVKGGFALPTDPKKAIALVFRILLDVDTGKMSLQNFLEAYFYSVSINESYARFCLEVITPFETYCRAAFARADGALGSVISEEQQKAYERVSADQKNGLKTDAKNCVATLIEIADETLTGAIDKAEYNACLKGLARALEGNDRDALISAFVGVKYAVAYFFKSSKSILEIFKKLEYDVRHLID